MNILFIKTPNEDWINISNDLSNRFGWNTVGWIGLLKNFENFNKISIEKNQKYFLHEKFLQNEVDDYISEEFKTYKESINDYGTDLKFHNPIIFELINRWFEFGYKSNIKTKINYTMKLLSDISKFIIQYKIDVIICPTIPHRIYDYIFYVLFKRLKKPFLMIEETAGAKIVDNKLKPIYFGIFDIHNRAYYKDNYQLDKIFKFDKDIDNLLKYFEKFSSDNKFHYNFERLSLKKYKNKHIKFFIPKIIRLSGSLISNSFNKEYNRGLRLDDKNKNFVRKSNILQNIKYKYFLHSQTNKALKYYKKISINSNLPKNYIFFAGSKIPERTQCPDCGLFFDPIRMLTKLSQNIPKNYFIVYKEHPSNLFEPFIDYRKSIFFYEKLLSLKNIVFADLEISTRYLIDNSLVTSSGTGTVGWEAAIRGKQSIIFGSVWYDNLKIVTRVNNAKDIKFFFSNYKKLSKHEINKEIYSFLNNIMNFSYDLGFRRIKMFDEKNRSTKKYFEKIKLISNFYYETYKKFKYFNQK